MEKLCSFVGFDGKPYTKADVQRVYDDIALNVAPEALDEHKLVVHVPFAGPPIDDWEPEPWDMIFRNCNNYILVPISKYYGIKDDSLDRFDISLKRCYNKPKFRNHLCHYLNYFCRFYDHDSELLSIYYQMKSIIDYTPEYKLQDCIGDLCRYIIRNKSIQDKAMMLVYDNYKIKLEPKQGKSVTYLQYRTGHGEIIMWMSLLTNMVIPIICHYTKINHSVEVDDALLMVYDEILALSYVDVYSKIMESANNAIVKNYKKNKTLWDMQDIRGKDPDLHSEESSETLILNILPKYVFTGNIVHLNYTVLRKNTKYKVTGIKYEYAYNSLSSSRRDEDFNSDFDKYESYQIRQNERIAMQNQFNCNEVMKNICNQNYFSDEEIAYYYKQLRSDGAEVINPFQREVIFNIFYKYFGDPVSIYSINVIDYIKLMILGKRLLLSANMQMMPYVVSSKIIKNPNRKKLTKFEQIELEISPAWKLIQAKFQNEKLEERCRELIAMIISGEYRIIDFADNEIDGKLLNANALKSILLNEAATYIASII